MTLLAPAVARPVQNVVVDFFVCLSLKRGSVLICRGHERALARAADGVEVHSIVELRPRRFRKKVEASRTLDANIRKFKYFV
jgi:hypothetical protein